MALVANGTTLASSELATLDGVTAGTATASKVLIVDVENLLILAFKLSNSARTAIISRDKIGSLETSSIFSVKIFSSRKLTAVKGSISRRFN